MSAKCAPIRAARQGTAVRVRVGRTPFIHVVSCCFRLVMIAPGAWLKTCCSGWCYSGLGEAASLLRQLTVKSAKARWNWVEQEAVVWKIIRPLWTGSYMELFTPTFGLLVVQVKVKLQKAAQDSSEPFWFVTWLVKDYLFFTSSPLLFFYSVCHDTTMWPSDSSTSPRLSKLNQMQPFSMKLSLPFMSHTEQWSFRRRGE